MTEPSQWMILVKTFGSLALVVALIYVLSWVSRRFLRPEQWMGSKMSQIQVIQVFAIEPKKKLMIVEVDNKRMLLGVAETSIAFLTGLQKQGVVEKLGDAEMAEVRNAIAQ